MIDHFGPAIKPQSLTREDEIYNLNKELPSLYNYKFSFLTDVWEWKRRFLKNGQGLTTFCLSPKAIIRQKSWKLQFMFPLTHKYIVHMYFIWKKISRVVLRRRRRTKTNCNRSHEWLGWPKDYKLNSFRNVVYCFKRCHNSKILALLIQPYQTFLGSNRQIKKQTKLIVSQIRTKTNTISDIL